MADTIEVLGRIGRRATGLSTVPVEVHEFGWAGWGKWNKAEFGARSPMVGNAPARTIPAACGRARGAQPSTARRGPTPGRGTSAPTCTSVPVAPPESSTGDAPQRRPCSDLPISAARVRTGSALALPNSHAACRDEQIDNSLNRGVRGRGGNASQTCLPGTTWGQDCRTYGYPLISAHGWLLSALLHVAPQDAMLPPSSSLQEFVADIPVPSADPEGTGYNHTVGAVRRLADGELSQLPALLQLAVICCRPVFFIRSQHLNKSGGCRRLTVPAIAQAS